jgi:hypothetical protein
MEVSEDKKSIWPCLDISPCFHTVPKHVQTLVITFNEIFQALAPQGDVLLPKTFLDLGVAGGVTWKSPTTEMFFQLANKCKSEGANSGMYFGGRAPETASGARRLLLPPGLV